MRVKCPAQEHNTMTRPGLEPGPLDPKSSALTTRPPCLPHTVRQVKYKLRGWFGGLPINIVKCKPHEETLERHCMATREQFSCSIFLRLLDPLGSRVALT